MEHRRLRKATKTEYDQWYNTLPLQVPYTTRRVLRCSKSAPSATGGSDQYQRFTKARFEDCKKALQGHGLSAEEAKVCAVLWLLNARTRQSCSQNSCTSSLLALNIIGMHLMWFPTTTFRTYTSVQAFMMKRSNSILTNRNDTIRTINPNFDSKTPAWMDKWGHEIVAAHLGVQAFKVPDWYVDELQVGFLGKCFSHSSIHK